jgi:hypothetical protein
VQVGAPMPDESRHGVHRRVGDGSIRSAGMDLFQQNRACRRAEATSPDPLGHKSSDESCFGESAQKGLGEIPAPVQAPPVRVRKAPA